MERLLNITPVSYTHLDVYKRQVLGSKKVGDIVNIETDLVGKYIERFVYFDKLEDVYKRQLVFHIFSLN